MPNNIPTKMYLTNTGQLSISGSAQNGSLSTSAISINVSGEPTDWLIDTNHEDYSNYSIMTNYDGRIVTWCLYQNEAYKIYTSSDAFLSNTEVYTLPINEPTSSSSMSYYGNYQTIVQGFSGFSTTSGGSTGSSANTCLINYGYIYGFSQPSQYSPGSWEIINSTPNICWKKVDMDNTGRYQIALNYNIDSGTEIYTNNSIYQSTDYGSTWNIIYTTIANNPDYAILDICMSRNGAIAYAVVSNGAYNLNQIGINDVPIDIYYSINDGGFIIWSKINYNGLTTYNLYSISTNYDGSIIYTGTFNYGNQNNIGIFKINITNQNDIPTIDTITNIQNGLIENSQEEGITTYEVMGVLQLVTNNDGDVCYSINAKLTQTITPVQEDGTQYTYTYEYTEYELFVYSNNVSTLISGSNGSNPTYNSICCSSYGYQAYASAIVTGLSSIQGTSLENNSYIIYASNNCKIILPDISTDTSITITIISLDNTSKIISTNNTSSYLYGIIPASMNEGDSETTETSTITLTEKYRSIFITSDTDGNFYFHFSSM